MDPCTDRFRFAPAGEGGDAPPPHTHTPAWADPCESSPRPRAAPSPTYWRRRTWSGIVEERPRAHSAQRTFQWFGLVPDAVARATELSVFAEKKLIEQKARRRG